MQIDTNMVVTIDYTLTDADNNILDKSEQGQFNYLHGAGNIIPGLENALSGKTAGDSLKVEIPPEDAYGHRDDSKTQAVSMDMFENKDDVQVGMQFNAEGPDGEVLFITVARINGDQVTVDANHPLAGMTLTFDVDVIDIRQAAAEELEHGHVHGPEGHQHD
ncbi:MAG: peptidylprolyl isomerase [Gammaproteobacteria bacterium]|nr:MAG: peptidylprolyl isomerase [Gammaproteobacteria bacterium]